MKFKLITTMYTKDKLDLFASLVKNLRIFFNSIPRQINVIITKLTTNYSWAFEHYIRLKEELDFWKFYIKNYAI